MFEQTDAALVMTLLALGGIALMADEKLGTARQLMMRNKKLRILNISCFPDKSFASPDWSKFEMLGDYVIITDWDLKRTY